MSTPEKKIEELLAENQRLRLRLGEAEETLEAIRSGDVDAVVIAGPHGDQVFTLTGSDRAYRILFETMNEGAAIVTSDGAISFCNTKLSSMLKTPMETIMGSSILRFIAKGQTHLAEALLAKGVDEPQKMEIALESQDGKVAPCLISTSPFRADDTSAICMVVTDLTERKRAEELVAVERQRLYDILETMPVMVSLLTPDYHVAFSNRSFREKFGEDNGRPCFDFCFGKKKPCEFCESYRVLETGKPHHWEVNAPDGSVIDAYDFPFTDTDGSPLILEMDIDVTEQRNAEAGLKKALADLTRSYEDLQQFAYVASHDLQEPLRNVASCLQMLERKYRNNLDADADKLIQYAVESSVRMKALILDLLEYSRVATKGKPPNPTDCEQILEQTVKNLRVAISEAEAAVTHDPLPTIFADATQLLLVFQNLVQNAIKFRKDVVPEIHVSATRNMNEWVFSIKDNGIGIDSRHLRRIFVIFQRLNKRSQYEGTGMGLAIAKKVVERHGGRVWVESEPGVGSTFYFTIPETGIRRR